MMDQVTVDRYTCDNCGTVRIVEADQERPFGYYLDVAEIHGGGGDAASNIYACREACIRGAVVKALGDRGRG